MLRARTRCTFSTLQLPKVVRMCGVWNILTSKCASRHNTVHFATCNFQVSPELRRFVHFHLEMCFAPQRRALFQHLNFQKCSEPTMFFTFWRPNVLPATTMCTFSTSPYCQNCWNIGKHSVSRLFYLFAHLDLLWSSFFWILFFSHSLSSHRWFFHLSKLSEVWLLNFLRYYR